MPTGSVQLTLPANAAPPPVETEPVVPYLPAVATKAPAPITSQIATTLLATNPLIVPGPATSTVEKPKRSHKLLVVAGAIVVATLLLGAMFRNTALVGRITGHGYDTNPLPVEAFPQPVFSGAVYILTTQAIAVNDRLPTNYWRTERDEVDYTANVAKLTIDRAEASMIGGTIGTPKSTSPAVEVVVDKTSTYVPGEAQTDPWTRHPHEPGWGILPVLSPHEVMMYQDVVDPVLRSQKPTSVISDVVHDVPVTTYSYTFDFGKFYESAPRVFDMVQNMDGNAAADAKVAVTVSFDEQWMVRYLDVNVDVQAVLKYKAQDDVGTTYPYRYTVDVVSTSESPPALSAPTNAVDATTTTTTTTIPVTTPVAP
jgi:hypothetical protein